ncbi:MAG: aminotransferase class III-fold pyridoxal phosphate-dependent enzyme [Spirochaetota bacterium]|nr:MAG: aminotransferase class III-fold pyridoxal phosphate-dependent enzyme [Spirochaetota bacterium]
MRKMNTSFKLSKKALELMPGPHSNLPGYELFKPIFLTHGKGAHLYDVDNNDYLDYIVGVGAGILGYGNQEVLDEVKSQIDNLYYLDATRRNPLEIELAEKIVKHVPCAEKVRYLLSGTEAVQLVIRLARAYTNRPYFIRFDGHYHGWLDNVLGGVVDPAPAGRPFALYKDNDMFASKGRDLSAGEQSFKLPWNDIEVLEKVLARYGEEVSLIIMEAINCNAGSCPPRPGYLERVRELCDEYGIVLCFDEIITGFRVGLSGAQGLLGVTPDLATLGKGIAGGIPFSVVAGKAKIMDQLLDRSVVGAGTFNGYPLGVTAAIATIKYLEKDDGAFYKRVEKVQKRLTSGLRDIAKKHRTPMLLQEAPGVFFYQFIDKEIAYNVQDWYPDSDHVKQERLRKLLFDAGVLIMFRARWYLSGGHTEQDVDKTLEIVEKAMDKC